MSASLVLLCRSFTTAGEDGIAGESGRAAATGGGRRGELDCVLAGRELELDEPAIRWSRAFSAIALHTMSGRVVFQWNISPYLRLSASARAPPGS